MRKDIEFPAVEGVQIAITRHLNDMNEPEWEVHFLNNNTFPLQNILITSTGYSPKDINNTQKQQTSTIRQHFDGVGAHGSFRIELIDPAVFHLCNEYWVSYYVGSKIYDKKFIFLPDTLVEANLIPIQMLEKEGILHS